MESLKKYLSNLYYTIPLTDNLQDQKLIVITSAGVIFGSPITNDEYNNDANTPAFLSKNYAKDYREENSLEPSQPLDGNDGFFVLKDVTFHTGSATFNFDFLNVFFDQVVAITVGKAK